MSNSQQPTNTHDCRNGCGSQIYFSSERMTNNGKYFPLDASTGEPHQCRNKMWSNPLKCSSCGKMIIFSNFRKDSSTGKRIVYENIEQRHLCGMTLEIAPWSGWNERGFNMEGIHKDTMSKYDTQGFDIKGIHQMTLTIFNPIGFNFQGLHRDTGKKYNPDGFDMHGNLSDGTTSNVSSSKSNSDETHSNLDKGIEDQKKW